MAGCEAVGLARYGWTMQSMYISWLVRDRKRYGLTAAQVAGRLGVTRPEYLAIEAGTRWPSSTVWERMVALFGWP